MTRKTKCRPNSKSNSFVAAVEQVCLQPVYNCVVRWFNVVQLIRDSPSLQQPQQQQPGANATDDDDDADGPQYAELAPTRRRSGGARAHVVNNSAPVYAAIVHFHRPQQQP